MPTQSQRDRLRALLAETERRQRQAVAKNGPTTGTLVVFSGRNRKVKAEAASALAEELDLELVRVDASRLAQQDTGARESSLNRVLSGAQRAGTLLYIEEGDALFGKCTEVKDSHDRYANVETNYLGRRLDDHLGLVVLSTNNNPPESLSSRVRYILEFDEDD